LLCRVWACRVAWYPCSFGSYRLEFKSQQAHFVFTFFISSNTLPIRMIISIIELTSIFSHITLSMTYYLENPKTNLSNGKEFGNCSKNLKNKEPCDALVLGIVTENAASRPFNPYSSCACALIV
jgi:hypothetical protein